MAIIDDKNLPARRPFVIDGTSRVIDRTAQTATLRLPVPQTTPSSTFAQKAGQKALGMAKSGANKAGRAWAGLSGATGLVTNAATPSEDYYERFGMARYDDSRGALGHFGIRALGYASDVGNAMSGGTIGDAFFADKIRQKKEAQQVQNTPTPTNNQANTDTQNQRFYYKKTPKNDVQNPLDVDINPIHAENPTAQPSSQSQSYAPQSGLGIPNNNPNYQALMEQINNMQQRTMSDTQAYFGRPTSTPQRDWQNEAQRKELLRQATTVHKGATGLTAAQMRLAHELSNDDIKMEQERHLQQNNLNHQLLQEQMQQQGQNQRALASEQGAMARAVMNEQGQNNRFNIGHGLDVYKTMQGGQQTQAELGLRLAELQHRSNNDQQDRMAQNEQMSLYKQFANAKDDTERDQILTQMAVLQGKAPSSGGASGKDRYMTVDIGDDYDPQTGTRYSLGQVLYDTQTGQYVGSDGRSFGVNGLTAQSQKPPEQIADLKKRLDGVSANEAKKIVLEAGYSPESVDAILAELKGA